MRLSEIWSAAGFLIGVQLADFSWRISREISMQRQGKPTWLPVADAINLLGLLPAVIGVFLLPIAGIARLSVPRLFLGMSLILFVGHAFALVGHYELFTPGRIRKEQKYLPAQELAAIIATVVGLAAFIAVAA